MSEAPADDPTIRVAVRIRPFNAREKELAAEGGMELALEPDGGDSVVVNNPLSKADSSHEKQKTFSYDCVFSALGKAEATQESVFQDIGVPIVENALNAYNGCLLAYGQTGSGKSHSMLGDFHSAEERGILPRACERFFDMVDRRKKELEAKGAKMVVDMRASYLEIYQEKMFDLLSSSRADLQVRLHPTLGPHVPSLTENPIAGMPEVHELLDFGAKNRAVGATAMNAQSSRSHAVFTVDLRLNITGTVAKDLQSKINFVDLAGSERQKKTGATGERAQEGIAINQSLSALSRVISALSSGKGQPPFRESKLTLLLKDSLSGNSRTALLACVSPSMCNAAESISTLEFASRCKLIKTQAKKNEQDKQHLVEGLTAEKNRVAAQLDEERQHRAMLQAKLEAEQLQARQANEELSKMSNEKRAIEEALRALEVQRANEKSQEGDQIEKIRMEYERKEKELQDKVSADKSSIEQELKAFEEQKSRDKLQEQQELKKLRAEYERKEKETAAKMRAEKKRMEQELKAFEAQKANQKTNKADLDQLRQDFERKELEYKKLEEAAAAERERDAALVRERAAEIDRLAREKEVQLAQVEDERRKAVEQLEEKRRQESQQAFELQQLREQEAAARERERVMQQERIQREHELSQLERSKEEQLSQAAAERQRAVDELQQQLAEVTRREEAERLKSLQQEQREHELQAKIAQEAALREQREEELRLELESLQSLQNSWGIQKNDLEEHARQQKAERENLIAQLGIGGLSIDAEGSYKDVPRIVNLHPDPMLEGCLTYFLPRGETRIGADKVSCEIILVGLDIADKACVVVNQDDKHLTIRKFPGGQVRVNGTHVPDIGQVVQNGDRVAVGRSHIFRLVVPQAVSKENIKRDEEDFAKAMGELQANTELDPRSQRSVDAAVLTVKRDYGTREASELLQASRIASETIAEANATLRAVRRQSPDWEGEVSHYELAVIFDADGPPNICVVARDAYQTNLGMWSVDRFMDERLSVMHDVQQALAMRFFGEKCEDETRELQIWVSGVWSEVRVDDFRFLALRCDDLARDAANRTAAAKRDETRRKSISSWFSGLWGSSEPAPAPKDEVPLVSRKSVGESIWDTVKSIGYGQSEQEKNGMQPKLKKIVKKVRKVRKNLQESGVEGLWPAAQDDNHLRVADIKVPEIKVQEVADELVAEFVDITYASLPGGKLGLKLWAKRDGCIVRGFETEAVQNLGWVVGDEIVAVNGKAVKSRDDLKAQVQINQKKPPVVCTVKRQQKSARPRRGASNMSSFMDTE